MTAHLEVPGFGRTAEVTTVENTHLESRWQSNELPLKLQAEQTGSGAVWHELPTRTLLGQGEVLETVSSLGKSYGGHMCMHRMQVIFLVFCKFLPLDNIKQQRKALLFSLLFTLIRDWLSFVSH